MDKNSLEYVEFLRRYTLVHSYIYYEKDFNVISDEVYDKKARELVLLQQMPSNQCGMYYDVFANFDGSTGFDLYHKLNEVEKERVKSIANSVINSYKTNKREVNKDKGSRKE